MEFLILGHLLGDFYVQTDHIADKKKKSVWYLLLHCVLYMTGMYFVLAVATGNFVQALKITIIIGLSHMCVDIVKVKADSRMPQFEYIVFLLDQAIHIAILMLIFSFFRSCFQIENYFFVQVLDGISLSKMTAMLIAGLLCWKPAAVLISLVFKALPKTVEDENGEEPECDKEEEASKKRKKVKNAEKISAKCGNQEEVLRIGSWIGILEREIILLLGLLGQYGAIGFVLTAKSLARYKQLEEQAFAEKYLVGTLLSALIAILCVTMCSLIR